MPRDGSPRILITRLSHVGDCILTLPVLNALRARYPGAYLAWVVEKPSDQLLAGHAALDRLIVLRRGWLKRPAAVRRLWRELRAMRCDMVIDPQSLTKSALLGWMSGAPRRIGLARPSGRELALWLNNERVRASARHVVDRSLELLVPLGIVGPKVRFDIPEDEAATRAVDALLAASRLADGLAVLNPGAGWRSRLWPAERFGQVAQFLGREHDLPSIVTWAGDEEHGWAKCIVEHSAGHAIAAPQTNLRELAALLARARLFVGSDTGPMHLAVAVGTDCVVLHGTTRPEESGPYGPRHIAVQRYYQSGTSRQRRRADNLAMQAVDADSVCEACRQILARQPARPESRAA